MRRPPIVSNTTRVADEIKQIGRGEKPGEQDVLSGWCSPQLRCKRVQRERIGIFPFSPLPGRRQRRAVLRHIARQCDGNLRRLEQAGSAKPGEFIPVFISGRNWRIASPIRSANDGDLHSMAASGSPFT